MSKKQLGAAPGATADSGRAGSRFAHLSAQPGFRTASVAFFLTVILGIGGPAAYAYWSQSTAVTVSGTTAQPVTPIPTVKCLSTPVRVEWPAAVGADPEVRYVVTFTASYAGQVRSVSYALAAGALKAKLSDFDLGSALGYTFSVTVPAAATVRSAIVRPGLPTATVKVTDADLIRDSEESTPANLWYSSSVREGVRFSCR